ncbi:hypothetical protein V6N11_045875 [Hibiscus sabdariffa]|uniref:EF-hand domain-containing protein n=1 Tax=Hibiscus sabdariffa TaxID=183260 RepID=A0ABR2Q2A1_9ROSI
MGQVLDKFHGKEWRKKRIRIISDKIFERVKNQSGRRNLTFEDLYIAILLVYNDINKRLPGPHIDPPSKDQIRSIMKECDLNHDGEINHDEFVNFIQKLTADTLVVISRGLVVTLVVAPTVALAAKRATEDVPGVGKMVQKVPNSVYASLATLVIVWIQASCEEMA